jgi:aldehyde:ferredoxin oxidoreductase
VYKTPPPEKGPLDGRHCDIDLLVRDWYKEMDWDIHSGKPKKQKLEALGLKDVARALY